LVSPKNDPRKKQKGARNFHGHFEAFSVFLNKLETLPNPTRKKNERKHAKIQVDTVHRALKEIFFQKQSYPQSRKQSKF
jgi:hypothetical protein